MSEDLIRTKRNMLSYHDTQDLYERGDNPLLHFKSELCTIILTFSDLSLIEIADPRLGLEPFPVADLEDLPTFKRRNEERRMVENYRRNEERRNILIGKTETEKNTLGNAILGDQCLKNESVQMQSITTQCQGGRGKSSDGKDIVVLDTPGLMDTKRDNKEMIEEDCKSAIILAPGMHKEKLEKERAELVRVAVKEGAGIDYNVETGGINMLSITKHYQTGQNKSKERKNVVVLDTPDFKKTKLEQAQIIEERCKCTAMTVLGPHSFCLVIRGND
ncbi:hypothetical protein CHS0354_041662 [Potamilus streckersoni]|uniref:Guanylate kinase-like domain-containing protein n=1 Tax=Potamilus streckersoni TaxID=2493646 RepID=A0AAE0SCI6_9BIVA|nr:hypothetical protein CHS0354_041662 [Potamilus streckersoni]